MSRSPDLGGAAAAAKGLVGLLGERSAIGQALDSALAGDTRVVLVEGELGSGRSALLGAARVLATDRSMRIMSTQGRRTDSEIGYSCLLTLLSGLERELDELAGSHASALRAALSLNAENTNALDVGLGLFRVVTTLAERSPVAILVDDIHLVDSATLEALGFTLGRLDADSVAGVLTVPSASASPLADVAHVVVPIGPRSIDELVEIAGYGVDVDPVVLAEVCERAAGNPLVAVATTQSLTTGQRLGLEPLPRVPKPPEALVRQFEATIDRLGEGARRALVMVAADLEGDKENIEAALVRLGEPPDGLRAVTRAGLVIIDGSRVRLAHPLLQEYAYMQVGRASRRAAHRALAETLAAPAQAAGRVWQLAAASDGRDDGLSESLELVADDAFRRGNSVAAAKAFARAAELTGDPECSRRCRRQAVRVMFEAGYPHEALAHLDGAGLGDSAAPQLVAVRERLMRWVGYGDVFGPLGSAPEDVDHELDDADEKILVAEQDFLEGRCRRLVDDGAGGVPWDPCEYLILRIRAMLALGMTGAAESLTAARLAVLRDRHSAVAAAVAAVRAEVLAATGDLSGAALLAEWSRPVLAARSLSSHLAELDRTIGRIAIARGDDAGAVSAFERIPVSEMHRAISDLVLVLVRLGDLDTAVAWHRRLEPRPELIPRIRRHCAAGLLGGIDEIKTAQKLAADASLPLEVATALSVESAWLRMNSREGEAAVVEAKTRAHLRPLGVRYLLVASAKAGEVDSGGGAAARSGAFGEGSGTETKEITEILSPAELRVAVSVAIGRTNKEAAVHLFISVKTVDFHLQNIYRKLGLRSRTELAVLMSATSLT